MWHLNASSMCIVQYFMLVGAEGAKLTLVYGILEIIAF
jgi:hypothetical protein